MPGLIGRKIGMTRIFDEDGVQVPVTVIEAGPCPVVQVKAPDNGGVGSVQVGFGAHMTLIEDYDPSLPQTLGDGDQLLQVFLNLLKNASEAADGDGCPCIAS